MCLIITPFETGSRPTAVLCSLTILVVIRVPISASIQSAIIPSSTDPSVLIGGLPVLFKFELK